MDIKSDFLSSQNSTDNVLLEENDDTNSDYIFCESSSDNQFLETEDFKSDTVQADSKNYTIFETIEIPYFLKFSNSNNSCYANSLIQAILAHGEKMFKIVSNISIRFKIYFIF